MKESEFKLNEYGEVDVDYYVAHAEQLRREYVAELTGKLVAKVKALFHIKADAAHKAVASH
ncbi:MAG: hypothetical protein CMI09_08830 [Oceanospirillaceae bacterium]|nr:hypothetical protein [Oceanospirillaceae bacterium]